MNLCVVIGKILEEVKFEFIYNNNNNNGAISIASSKIEIANKTQIEVYGLNKKADYMYRNININDVVYIYGRLVNSGEKNKIKIEQIEKTNSK